MKFIMSLNYDTGFYDRSMSVNYVIKLVSNIIRLGVGNSSAVWMQGGSGDERAVLGAQEDETGSNLDWLTWTSHWRGELLLCRGWHGSRDERSPDWSWSNGVDTDATRQLLIGESTRECHDCPLSAGVVKEIWTADVVVDAGVDDDGIAASHGWEDVLGEEEERMDVGVEGVQPLVLGEIIDALLDFLGAVVQDQDVDGAHQLSCLLSNGLALLHLSQVGSNEVQFAALLLSKTLGLLSILLLLWQVNNGRLSTLHGIKDGGSTSNTRVSTSDQRLASCELAGSTVWHVASLWCWDHVVDGLLWHLSLLSWDGLLVGDWDPVVLLMLDTA